MRSLSDYHGRTEGAVTPVTARSEKTCCAPRHGLAIGGGRRHPTGVVAVRRSTREPGGSARAEPTRHQPAVVTRVHPGVVCIPGYPDTFEQRTMARPPESVVETQVLGLMRSFDLPSPVAQHLVSIPGSSDIRVDFAYPELRIAIEVDSVRWHSGLRAIHRDNRRQNLLAARGWLVLCFEWDDIVGRPKWVAQQILAAIEARVRELQLG